MELLLVYDVETSTPDGRRRLRRVARLCEGHGLRVQKSVFEIILDEKALLRLMDDLERIINSDTDSVRIYRLPPASVDEVHTLGIADVHPHRQDLVL